MKPNIITIDKDRGNSIFFLLSNSTGSANKSIVSLKKSSPPKLNLIRLRMGSKSTNKLPVLLGK